jgi:hypothetical protein
MSAVIAKVLFGILGVGASVMLTYLGVKALRTGSHIERGVRYTGKSARQIGWLYIGAAIASTSDRRSVPGCRAGQAILASTQGNWSTSI